jgi:O-antigen ligase
VHTPTVRPKVVRFYLVISFLLGFAFTGDFSIRLVGSMPISEFLLLGVLCHATLCIAVTRRLPAPIPAPRVFLFFCVCQLVAFGSYIISDLLWMSTPIDLVRGWSRMAFLLIDIVAFAFLFGATGRCFVMFEVGRIFGATKLLVVPPLFGDYWKFGFGPLVTVVALLVVPRFLGFWATFLACIGLGVLNSALGSRSHGAVCLLVGLLIFAHKLPRVFLKVLFMTATLLVIVTLPWTMDRMLGKTGGSADRSNVERSAMLQAAWEGFLASPVIGNGSWFSKSEVWDNFLLIRSEKEREFGGGLGFDPNDFEGAAIHSQILTTLCEGGLLGGTFFAALAAFTFWALWYCLTTAQWSWLMPIRLIVLIGSFWAIYMAAFAGPVRVNIAMTTALILLLWNERRIAKPPSAKPRNFRLDDIPRDSCESKAHAMAQPIMAAP